MKYSVIRTAERVKHENGVRQYETNLEILSPDGHGTGNFIIVTSNEPDVFEPLARYEIEIPDEVTD